MSDGHWWHRIPAFRRARVRERGQRPRRVSQAVWWEQQWRQPLMRAHCVGRPVSPEIVTAASQGWLPAGAHVLDAGCGEGIVAHWLSRRGFTALGIDIAPSAIQRARALHGESDSLRFGVADLRSERPPTTRPFDAVIDRGCFHQMRDLELPAYARNLASACAPEARMLILYRAYRRGIPYGDPAERERIVSRVRHVYAGLFELERAADTWLDRSFGSDPASALGGVALWLRRTPSAG